jgi:putative membrane protein
MRNRTWLFAALALAGLLAATSAFAQASAGPQAGAAAGAPAQGNPAAQPMQDQPSAADQPANPAPETPAPSTPSSPSAPRSSAGAGPGGGAGAEVAAPDKSFLQDAAHANMEEMELGHLAAEKAENPDVKAFGQKLADDHGKAQDQLKQVASTIRIVLPSGMTSRSKAEKARLEKLSGGDFDRAFIQVIIKDHEKDIQEFNREARREMAPGNLKNFASAQLTNLKDHLKMAEDLRGKLGGSTAGASSPGHS